MSRAVFWISLFMVAYAYFGYPLVLYLIRLGRGSEPRKHSSEGEYAPTISMLMPAHNEEGTIEAKIRNTLTLEYPRENLQIIVVSDGSTDATNSIVRKYLDEGVTFIDLETRRGKAQALNAGLSKATGEIIVFSDASILLDTLALRNIVQRFRDESIGCVSGEDHIKDGGGEGFYGRYELYLRNLESAVHSIVGASGSFYAQRRLISIPFREGMAPDFLSVLQTLEKGYRAVTEPSAFGTMSSASRTKDEFTRKERTILRGMTTLYYKKNLLNPFRYGIFSLSLFSHKLVRWLVPFFMILLFASNAFLVKDPYYMIPFLFQVVFYLVACVSLIGTGENRSIFSKIPHYFCISNAAILTATVKFFSGVRQEIWTPTKR